MPTTPALFALFALFTTGSAMGVECVGTDPATKYCNDSNGLIGMCNGTDTTCVTAKPCENKVKDLACGDLTGSVAMLKGKCDSTGTNCVFTTMCASGDTNTKYCNDSNNAIGTCNGTTCQVTSQCTGKAMDAACGYVAGNVVNLKGKCADNAGIAATKCMFTAGSVPCAAGDLTSKYCNDSNGYIGQCYGPTCQVATHCTGKANDAACGNVAVEGTPMLKGRCEAAGAKCMFTTMCSAGDSNKKICNDSDGYIGKCSGTTCQTDKHCGAKASNDACGHLTGAVAMLKGKCDTASTKKCMFTTTCATQDTAKKYCNDANNNIGTCTSGNCVVTGQCNAKDQDAACGYVAGSVANLKGKCADDNKNDGTKCAFTAGSVPCASGDSSSKNCNDSNSYIGQCFSEYCKIDTQCEGKAKNAACGASSGNAILMGRCEAAGRKCKYTKKVHVDYYVQAGAANVAGVRSKLIADIFPSSLTTSLNRPVSQSGIFCADQTHNVPNGTLTCLPFTRSVCSLRCNQNYTVKTESTRKCATSGAWEGEVGQCESRCPDTIGGTQGTVDVASGKLTVKVTKGTLTCDSLFNGAGCSLVCDNPAAEHPKPDTNLKCVGTAWTGTKIGACTDSLELSASAEVRLNPSDNYQDTIDKNNAQFNSEFKAAVAASVGNGVSAENVFIVNIKAPPSGGSRRLDERSVLVDYTVEYTKGDLPVEGGLRGIR